MFWDGTRWIDERAPAAAPPPSHRRTRDWLATGVMILGIVALAIPFVATSAASSSADRLMTAWSGSYQTRVFQESTVLAKYVGTWNRQQGDQFMGSYAAISTQAGAAVDFSFTGSAVSWIGPEGPNQGKARVYLDGRYVRTVDTYSRNPRPRESLFTALFSDVTDHTLSIHVLASTAGRVVTMDAFVVRDPLMASETSTQTPTPPANPTPGPTPAAVAAPTPTPGPTPAAVAAPTPTPGPTPAAVAAPTPTPTPTPAAVAAPTPTPTPKPAAVAAPTPTPTPAAVAAPTPTPTPKPAAVAAPTPTPTAAPTPTPRPTATPTPTPTSAPTPTTTSTTVRVASIPALLDALANDAVTEIVVANGTYYVSGAVDKAANSLWIGSRFAGRTRPVLVRAETTGGVTFDGSQADYFGGISFQEGAHDQTWQGFVFAHGSPVESGVIMFGGYAGSPGAHHITLRDITIDKSVTSDPMRGHAVYFSYSVGGVHDILIDGFTVDNSLGGIKAALHFYHSDAANRNAWNVLVRNMHVIGTSQFAIVVWDPTAEVVVEDSTITGAKGWAVRFEQGKLTLRSVTSTGSALGGFYSSLGANPPGVTFDNVSLR
jgi:hypothetical protein